MRLLKRIKGKIRQWRADYWAWRLARSGEQITTSNGSLTIVVGRDVDTSKPVVRVHGDSNAAELARHARQLAAAEADAERSAKLSRFKDGALIKAKDGTVYVAQNVRKAGWHVSMTLQRATPKRPAGMSARQWDRMRKDKRRRERELRASVAVTPEQMRQIDADRAEARRLVGAE